MNEVKNFINPNILPTIKCKSCEGTELFELKYRLKKVGRLQSSTGQEGLIPLPVYICCNCGTELKEI